MAISLASKFGINLLPSAFSEEKTEEGEKKDKMMNRNQNRTSLTEMVKTLVSKGVSIKEVSEKSGVPLIHIKKMIKKGTHLNRNRSDEAKKRLKTLWEEHEPHS